MRGRYPELEAEIQANVKRPTALMRHPSRSTRRPHSRALGVLLTLSLALGCATRGMDMPIGMRVMAETYLAFGNLQNAIAPVTPDVPEGFESIRFREVEGTIVGLDASAKGDVFLAVSHRQQAGASDNRFKPYWLLDDLASQSVADRRTKIEKWATRGGDPLSWYTEKPDVVVRLRDGDGDGVADERSELASFREIETGIGASVLADGDSVWFTDIPDLWRLRDADDDGVAEERTAVATGFGVTTSLVGHDLHGLTWGPDGRLYFSIGDRGYRVTTREGRLLTPPMVVSRGAVFRIQPDGSELEVFATGLRNPQDLVFDDFGNLFTGDNNGDGVDEARLVHVVEGGDTGWAMPVQTMEGDYFHGPWEAERLWETQHEGQPAWALPPIGYIGRGPAGVAMDPGLGGLPEAMRGRILICDYQYAKTRSGIHAYGVEPHGAGFRMTDSLPVFGSLLPTDLTFGSDGAIYVSEFDQFGGGGSVVYRFANPAHLTDPSVVALRQLLETGFEQRATEELATLLGHEDRRARRGAQRTLVARSAGSTLAAVARDEAAPLLARVHALWGLGQLDASTLREAGWRDLAWTRTAPAELRSQAFQLVGETGATWLAGELLDALADDDAPRAQTFAANALGKLRDPRARGPLVEVLRRNADRDVFLRHAAVFALARIGELDALLRYADDPSRAVRLGVLLTLRHHGDPRLERFLGDPEPALVTEAARAIYDLDIRAALPALAALSSGGLPAGKPDDRQSTQALHRRVLAANLALGEAEHAKSLAAYAADPTHSDALRGVALDALASFTRPEPREPVWGMYRGWETRPDDRVYAALDQLVPALQGGALEARALEIALAAGRVPLPDEELLDRVDSWFGDPGVKRASLQVLAERDSPLADEAIDSALDSRHADLRATARDVLVGRNVQAGVAAVLALSKRAPVIERQRGYAVLARAGTPGADTRLRDDLAHLRDDTLAPELALDLLEAARKRGASLADELRAYEATLPEDDLLAPRRVALYGGDPERGQRVFESAGDCLRCHSTQVGDGGHGSRAGPNLDGVGKRERVYLLESVVDPQAEVAAGFGTLSLRLQDGKIHTGTLIEENETTVTLEIGGDLRSFPRTEIVDTAGPTSSMPPMGLALTTAQLRDLIAYLATL